MKNYILSSILGFSLVFGFSSSAEASLKINVEKAVYAGVEMAIASVTMLLSKAAQKAIDGNLVEDPYYSVTVANMVLRGKGLLGVINSLVLFADTIESDGRSLLSK